MQSDWKLITCARCHDRMYSTTGQTVCDACLIGPRTITVGPDGIGRDPESRLPLPHYPSSAELAAFRESLVPYTERENGIGLADMHDGADIDSEREHGIGYGPNMPHALTASWGLGDLAGRRWDYLGSQARSMAAAQRTAAYAAAPVESSYTDRR